MFSVVESIEVSILLVWDKFEKEKTDSYSTKSKSLNRSTYCPWMSPKILMGTCRLRRTDSFLKMYVDYTMRNLTSSRVSNFSGK